MNKDKPNLTLSFNNKDKDPEALRARTLERINRARGNIIIHGEDDSANFVAAKDVSSSTKLTTGVATAASTKVTGQDNSKPADAKKVILPPKKHKIDPNLIKKLDKYFRETFPLCFTEPISPLAVGIHHQLRRYKIEHPDSLCSNSYIYKFLYVYTRNIKYKRSLIAGVDRFNIDGSVGGVVTPEEAEKANEDLARLEQIKRARLAQKIERYNKYKERTKTRKDEPPTEAKNEKTENDFEPETDNIVINNG